MNKNKIITLIVAALAAFGWQLSDRFADKPDTRAGAAESRTDAGAAESRTDAGAAESRTDAGAARTANANGGSFEQTLQLAFQNRQNDLQIEGEGTVSKILPDDNKGARHQRFILKLGSGQTLLVAHNIDLAPKIKNLKKGDTVGFYGEYEWSGQGGVIHWTHHDPAKRHADGWLKHNGQVYQ